MFVDKVCVNLSKWTWVLPQLSYRGRVLVANNLIVLLLWHGTLTTNLASAEVTGEILFDLRALDQGSCSPSANTGGRL